MALDEKQEKAFAKAVEKTAKLEERVAKKEAYRSLQLEFNSIRMELRRLPREEKVAAELTRLDELEAKAKEAGAAPKPVPADPGGKKPADDKLAKVVEKIDALEKNVMAGEPYQRLQLRFNSIRSELGRVPASEEKTKTEERLQQLEEKCKAGVKPPLAPGEHPQGATIAQWKALVEKAITKLEPGEPDSQVKGVVDDLKAKIPTLDPQDHALVAELKARFEVLEKRHREVEATYDRRNEQIETVKRVAQEFIGGAGAKLPELRNHDDAEVDRYLGEVAAWRKRGAEAAALAAKILAEDPKIVDSQLAKKQNLKGALETCERYEGWLDASVQANVKRCSDEAAKGTDDNQGGKRALAAARALKKLAPERAEEADALIASIEKGQAASAAEIEKARLKRRADHRFPKPEMTGPDAEKIRDAYLAQRSKTAYPLLKFAVTKDAWTLVDEWRRDGDKMVRDHYEWIYIHEAIAKDGEPGVAIDFEFELRRTPGATDLTIYRKTMSWEMLLENLEK
jgi:hypothetical protein